MKTITLSRGLVACVDDDDFNYINQWKWCADKIGRTWYAERVIVANGKKKKLYMHRVILSICDKSVDCDHRDGNGLNNQRVNLRPCTRKQNAANKKHILNKSSRFRGVWWDKKGNKWVAEIFPEKTKISIGRFENEIDAAIAWNQKAREIYGEFANLNIIPI